jgi:hypothetical protein
MFYYFSWSFNYIFICETFNKIFNLHEKQLGGESISIELYDKTYKEWGVKESSQPNSLSY